MEATCTFGSGWTYVMAGMIGAAAVGVLNWLAGRVSDHIARIRLKRSLRRHRAA